MVSDTWAHGMKAANIRRVPRYLTLMKKWNTLFRVQSRLLLDHPGSSELDRFSHANSFLRNAMTVTNSWDLLSSCRSPGLLLVGQWNYSDLKGASGGFVRQSFCDAITGHKHGYH